jgi:hypothetical protein
MEIPDFTAFEESIPSTWVTNRRGTTNESELGSADLKQRKFLKTNNIPY